jgi:hypothetical protein
VCSHSLNRAELGELIDAGHRLGILRLATIAPRPYLGKATELVRKIEHEIGFTLRLITNQGSPRDIQKKIEKIHIEMFPALSTDFGGNIRNRLRHSLRYKKQLDELMLKIGVLPLGNLKSFEQATEEYVSSTVFRIEQLLESYNTILNDYYERRQIATNEGILKKNSKIEELQIAAEMLAFVVLLPYYLGHSTTETYRVLFESFNKRHVEADAILWVFAWSVGIGLALYRLAKSDPIKKLLKKLQSPSFVLVFVGILTLCLWMVGLAKSASH